MHPDSHGLITDTFFSWVRVAVYDTQKQELVDAGWQPVSAYKSWTLGKFNWQKRQDANKKK
jgi:hypothetical protein